jgi:hypothetical protein
MSTVTETSPQNESETDEAAQGTPADIDTKIEPLETEEDESVVSGKSVETDTSIGEWSLCASIIFLAGYLVALMFWVLGPDLIDVTVSPSGAMAVDGEILSIGDTKFEIDFNQGGVAPGNVPVVVQTGDTPMDIAKAIENAIMVEQIPQIREAATRTRPSSWIPFNAEAGPVVTITRTGYTPVIDNNATGFSAAEAAPVSLIFLKGEDYRTEFPVGIATILLLISVLSGFCSLISLVADTNNRRTLLIRILTIGPVLPICSSIFMIWIIIARRSGNSILENFLG